MIQLAIVVSHPIQYYAPWFAYLAANLEARVRVFYLWDFGVRTQKDPGFGCEVLWDVELLANYEHEFVANAALRPGTDHLGGLRNPGLIDALADWKPDAILLFGYKYWSHLRLITSSRLRKIPLLFRGDSHLLSEDRGLLGRMSKRAALQLLFRRFSAFLSVGRANTTYFRRHGVPDGQIFFAPHSVDHERFLANDPAATNEAEKWRSEMGIPSSHRVILFAGKFEAKKRPDDLLRAFLAAGTSEATLLFVGAGRLEEKLRAMAGRRENICFAPFQNQSTMPRTYAGADVVVLPSFGAGETWGFAIHEAMCCGRAVIVSDHVGCHLDLVHPGGNGLVFPAGDVKALTKTLREALSPTGRLKKWGAESSRIASNYRHCETTAGLQCALQSIFPGAPV